MRPKSGRGQLDGACLYHGDDLHLVEEDEGAESGERVVVDGGLRRRRQHHVDDVLHPVRLMDLLHERDVVEWNHLQRQQQLRNCCDGRL